MCRCSIDCERSLPKFLDEDLHVAKPEVPNARAVAVEKGLNSALCEVRTAPPIVIKNEMPADLQLAKGKDAVLQNILGLMIPVDVDDVVGAVLKSREHVARATFVQKVS